MGAHTATPAPPQPWSLMATTPVTTSRSSRASNVFSGVDGIDRIERNDTHRAGANQVEGLVRDNRVEVRVLLRFIARPQVAGLFVSAGSRRTRLRVFSPFQRERDVVA